MSQADQYLDKYKFSASQIENWSGCTRRGAFTYLLQLRGKGTPSTDLGTAVHKVLEDYQKYGAEIDTSILEGAIAIHALPYIKTGYVSEGDFEFHTGRHWWRGYKDLRAPGHVIDYKTTKDFKWAKTPEILHSDPQAMLYAAHEFYTDLRLTEVELTWLYLRTKEPHQAKPVHLRVFRDHADRAMQALDDMADEVMTVVRGGEGLVQQKLRDYVLSLGYNSNECFKYNKPCDFSGLCNLTPIERFASKVHQDSLRCRIAQIETTQRPSHDGKQPILIMDCSIHENTVPKIEIGVKMNQDSLFARLRSQNAAEDKTEAAINPPEYQPPPVTTPEQDAKAAKAVDAVRKAEEKAKKAAEKVAKQSAATVPDVTKAAQEAVARVDASSTPMIKVLLVDCMLTNGQAVDFAAVVQRAKILVKEEVGVDDWRFIQYTAAGVLLQAVTAILDELGTVEALMVDSKQPEAVVCLGLLKTRSIEIIRGL